MANMKTTTVLMLKIKEKKLLASIMLGLLLSILLIPEISEQHLDTGDHMVFIEVVIDKIDLISTDEADYDDDDDGDDVRFYCKIGQTGHTTQECIIAFEDQIYEGYIKEDYEKLERGQFDDHPPSHIVVGKFVYLHLECDPVAPFNLEFGLWDNDSWSYDYGDILEEIKKMLELAAAPKYAIVLPLIDPALQALINELQSSSRDNVSRCARSDFYDDRWKESGSYTYTAPTVLIDGSNGWEHGDIGAKIAFTINIEHYDDIKCRTEKGCPNLEGYQEIIKAKISQLDLEEALKEKIRQNLGWIYNSAKEGRVSETTEKIKVFKSILFDYMAEDLIDYESCIYLGFIADTYLCTMQPISYDPPIYRNYMVFPTSESYLKSDLNGDDDTNDTTLCYQILSTGEIVNTGFPVSATNHSIDIYENFIAFIGEDLLVRYYNINTGAIIETGAIGTHPSIHGNIIAFESRGTIHYFDLSTQTLADTKITGTNPTIYDDLIIFSISGPEHTIWTYDLHTGDVISTGVNGENPVIFKNMIAFETQENVALGDLNGDGESDDWVIRYYDLETQSIADTGAVGRHPALYGELIVFSTREQDVNQDLNGDGRISGDVIRYYDIKTGCLVNTQKLGTEPCIFDNTITFYQWEYWTGQDINRDGDTNDPIVGMYHIPKTEMTIAGGASRLFLALLVVGCIAAYLERRK
ncbi:MAG: WD40 repeat domain-containing protein [Candidatus Methanofastidiosia archaeon]